MFLLLFTSINGGGKFPATFIMLLICIYCRFITPMFAHVGVFHLLINLLVQILLGIQLERSLGEYTYHYSTSLFVFTHTISLTLSSLTLSSSHPLHFQDHGV